MTSTIDAKSFYKALKHLDVFNQKAKVLFFDEVCIRFREDSCTLSATDVYNEISVNVPASGDSFDFVFCTTKKVINACRYFEGLLTITLNGADKEMRVTMRCGDKSAVFPVIRADDYYTVRDFEPEQSYTANAAALLERMKRVKYAAMPYNNQHPDMEGFQFYGSQLFCVDGYRLAVSEDSGLTVTNPFVISKTAVNCLKEMGTADVQIDVGKRLVRFRAGNITAFIQRIQSNCSIIPEKVIPKQQKESYTIDRRKYLNELDYLKQCYGAKGKAIVQFENGVLSVQQQEACYQAKVEVAGNCDVIYAFDVEFMRDALSQFSGTDQVRIQVSSHYAPITITAEGTTDTALVLPYRTRSAA